MEAFLCNLNVVSDDNYDLKAGRFEGWKTLLEKAGKLEFLHISTNSCRIQPSRAPQARSEALVTVYERGFHPDPPAKDRPGPSDDDDNDDGNDENVDDMNMMMIIIIIIVVIFETIPGGGMRP